MIYSESKAATFTKATVTVVFSASLALAPFALAHDPGKDNVDAAVEKTVTGEIVDVMCYVDHKASGENHADCAAKCIKGGGPVGIASEGKVYLVVGEHKPMNDELAEYAGKTVTLKGKVASNGGVTMLENAEIVKK
jgi:hypothetical protein